MSRNWNVDELVSVECIITSRVEQLYVCSCVLVMEMKMSCKMLVLVCLLDNLNWYVQLSMYLYVMLSFCFYSYVHEYDVLVLFCGRNLTTQFLSLMLFLYDTEPNH